MNELAQPEKRAKQAACGQEFTYKVVLSSLRRDCADPDLTLGELVHILHAPPLVCFDLYVGDMILINYPVQKTSQ